MNPKPDPNADPNCKHCSGKGYVLVQIDRFDVEKDPCDCVLEEEKDEAK